MTKSKLFISTLLLMNLLAMTTPLHAFIGPDAGPDQYTLSGETVTLTGTVDASYLAVPDAQYEWDFGDGSPIQTGVPSSTTVSVTHQYVGSPGTMFVATFSIWVNGIVGEWESDTVSIMINIPPVANANGPYEVYEGETFQLDGSGSYDPDGTIVNWEWDLDNDGTYDTVGEVVEYSYPSVGVYPVTLRVTDDLIQTDTHTTTVTVKTDTRAQIIVKKEIKWGIDSQYVNDPVFDFTLMKTAVGIIDTFSLGDECMKILKVEPGQYQVVENLMGWSTAEILIKGAGYDDVVHGNTGEVTIDECETITITFINRPPDFVIPEAPFGTLLILAAMLIAYLVNNNKMIVLSD
jgi:hypothetical protein